MHGPAVVDIYSGPLLALTDGLLHDIARVFNTTGRAYIYITNGHGAWEAAVTNVLSKGDKILVLESGRFAVNWGAAAGRMGVEVETLKGDIRRAVRPAELEARLKADEGRDDQGRHGGANRHRVGRGQRHSGDGAGDSRGEARRAVHGRCGRFPGLRAVRYGRLGRRCPAMSASQKGMMTPPGLGFVAANARAREIHKTAGLRTPYWDWTEREGDAHYQKYCGTPPEHLLFGLRQALDMLFAEGLENVFRRHSLLAEAVRRAVGVWSKREAIDFNIIEPGERSDTVTAVRSNGHDPQRLRAYCNENCGVILGHGIGDLTGKAFRIAHMGHVNAPMILGTLSVVEMALGALGIPHGKGGTQAAIDWLSDQVKA